MKRREKLILSGIILLFGTVFSLFFTAAIHGLLSRQYESLTLIPFSQCVEGLFTQRQQLLLFLSFEGFIALCCMLFFVQNNRPYQSQLINVTEDIQTPASVGQFQHGSSRWLREKEKAKVFSLYALDPNHKVIRELIGTGYDGLDFLKEEKPSETEVADLPAAAVLKKAAPQIEPAPKPAPLKKDRYKLLKEGGIVIGMTKEGNREHIYYLPDDTHTLTIGATRSGKTRTLVIQSVCLLGLAGESLVISDPKAEIFEYTGEFLAKLGYEVICLDFKTPEKSTRYNLLQPIIDAVNRNDMEKAEMCAWDITNILVGDNVSNEKIWENGEKSTIAAAILCVVVDNAKRPEYQNLTNTYWFIAEMSKSVGGKTPMQEYVKKLKSGHPARALLSISDVAPSRTKGSFYTSALTTLRLFTSKSVYSITHKSDYDIAEIGRKKQALFFILPDEKSTYYPIASLMVSQLYELLVRQSDERGGRLINRVNFILDEFGNFTKLNDFTNKLTVGGGRGMRFNLFLQSFEQLTEK